jgi:hypothetical protein
MSSKPSTSGAAAKVAICCRPQHEERHGLRKTMLGEFFDFAILAEIFLATP